MIENYFKIAWRNIIRRRGYSVINIAGLSVGIAACLLIFVVIKYELSFDTFQPGYKNIYHLVTRINQSDDVTYNPGVVAPASEALRLDFPQAKVAALEANYGSQLSVPANNSNAGSDKKFTENLGVVFIEPQFFDIFKWTWLDGQPSVLNEPDMVVLDKSTATKYFGDWKNAMGKILKMDNLLTLKVAGIVDDAPNNSDFPLKIMVSYISWKEHPRDYNYVYNWHATNSAHEVYLQLPANTSISKMDVQLKSFSVKHFDNQNAIIRTLFLQPLAALHFDTRFSNTLGDHLTSMATLRTLSFIGLLIIIMAAINFINLSTAQSVGRSKEVGIRKVLGSNRSQLIIQVIGETTIIVGGAVILAVIIAKAALPYLINIANVPQDIGIFNLGCLLFLIGIAISVILLSGLYPALIISGFKPVLALKNKITAASVGGIPLRRTLVVAQFAISQLLIIGTIVAVNQMDYVNKADLGFNKDAILIIPGYTDSISLQKMNGFKQQLLQNSQVKAVSFISDPPSSENGWGTNFNFNNSIKDRDFTAFLKLADADYFKTFGLKFVAGKSYDVSDTMRQAVVNETMMHKLGVIHPQDMIGKTIRIGGLSWSTITGVVADFKTTSLREAIRPIIIFPRKTYEAEAAIKIQTHDLKGTVAAIQKLWEGTYPEYAYNAYFLDDTIAKFYQQENQLALVYKIFAGIAIFISCLGLYGLVSFMAVQRTKEVGIRKVLGASVSSIVYLFSKEFAILILISFVIAVPVAWYIMASWLRNFVYRIHLSPWVFISAIIISIVIAWLTVGYKAIKAALANPVKSLRSE
ncbi:ABC transporter permease [Mucilaginibacter sp. X5P1]|uniref:ABC transporter permease n=1 Tax=Mucilaginibacter sp. X5P1 TaxID=2723088 RepID=UPI001618A868|nr:ABC transporter permease [Mucilaginibacter sp. X5P1]MBB6138446.1 putative permease [Mucilaginibacter sp. X5P1]